MATEATKYVTPFSEAWDAYRASERGAKALEGSATGEYLENRLWHAFAAGWDAGLRRALERPSSEDSPP